MLDLLGSLTAALASEPCVLLVDTDVQRLGKACAALGARSRWPVLSVGRSLSAALLAEPVAQRPYAARAHLDGALRGASPGPVLCADVDLTFEPSLELDPLALFQGAGRVTRLVVAWPGSFSGGVLAYAVPEHGHYRTWRSPRIKIHVLE